MDGWVEGDMDGWVDGNMDGWVDGECGWVGRRVEAIPTHQIPLLYIVMS